MLVPMNWFRKADVKTVRKEIKEAKTNPHYVSGAKSTYKQLAILSNSTKVVFVRKQENTV